MMTKAEKQRLEELMAEEDDQQDNTQILDIQVRTASLIQLFIVVAILSLQDGVSEESKALCPFTKSVSAFSLPESDQARLRELDRFVTSPSHSTS